MSDTNNSMNTPVKTEVSLPIGLTSKEVNLPIGLKDVYNWIRGYPNKIDMMREQRVKQIERRKTMLNNMDRYKDHCSEELNEYYKHNIMFGLLQQEELLSSSISDFYTISQKHVSDTNKSYDKVEEILKKESPFRCSDLKQMIDFDKTMVNKK
jgi:hypothetical protein